MDVGSLDNLKVSPDSELDWVLSARGYFVASFMHEEDALIVKQALEYVKEHASND